MSPKTNEPFHENEFKIDREGRTVFFPFGKKNTGYILPEGEKKEEIIRLHNRYTNIATYIFYTGTFIDFLLMPAMLVFYYTWYHAMKKAVKGLPISDLQLSKDEIRKARGIELLGIIVMIFLFSGFFFVICMSWGVKGFIVGISTFFIIIVILITVAHHLITKQEKAL